MKNQAPAADLGHYNGAKITSHAPLVNFHLSRGP